MISESRMLDLMVKTILIQQYILVLSYAKYQGIELHIEDPPINFGEDAILFCNVSVASNCCSNTATWMRDYDVIVHHGTSVDFEKYQQRQHENGFSLIIKSFNEKDLNHQYTCLYEFYASSRTVEMNNNDFQLIPHTDAVRVEISSTENKVVATVVFDKVFPLPHCNVSLDREITPSQLSMISNSDGLFHNATIQVVCEMNTTYCDGNLIVDCLIGKTNISRTEKFQSDCQLKSEESSDKIIPVLVALVFLLTVIACVVIFIKIKKRFYSRHSNLEGSVNRSMLSCLKIQDTYVEENEMRPLLSKEKKPGEKSWCFGLSFTPAQRPKDVKMIIDLIYNWCNKKFHQLIATNCRINHARHKNQTRDFSDTSMMRFNSLISSSRLGRKKANNEERRIDLHQLLVEVNRRINEARRFKWIIEYKICDGLERTLFSGQEQLQDIIDFDNNYDQWCHNKKLTNARINEARCKKHEQSHSDLCWIKISRQLDLSYQSASITTERKVCHNPTVGWGNGKKSNIIIVFDDHHNQLLRSNQIFNQARFLKYHENSLKM